MQEVKPWYLSKTIWGVIIAFLGFILNQFFKTTIPDVSSQIVELIGLAIAVVGRFNAESKIG
jgi:hypothetical protein